VSNEDDVDRFDRDNLPVVRAAGASATMEDVIEGIHHLGLTVRRPVSSTRRSRRRTQFRVRRCSCSATRTTSSSSCSTTRTGTL